jgi:NADPH:quinone reductase-like Zn-dependent oxidoreductase
MKAIVYTQYGSADVLKVQDVDKPVVGDADVLVRVRAASVNPYDWHFMRGEPYVMRLMFGLGAPKSHGPLGADFAGEVEAVGRNVSGFRPGDAVMGFQHGSFAEYVSAPAEAIGLKPANLTFEEAATLPLGALTALQGLRDEGEVKAGQRVLIVGASGGVGIYAVQIAKLLGAHVTGVCSARNAEFVRSLGADDVVDYTKDDFTQAKTRYDVILQLAGKETPAQCRRALNPTGILVLSSGDSDGTWIGPITRILAAKALGPFVSQQLRVLETKKKAGDLAMLKDWVEAGKLRPVVDRVVTLGEVPRAIEEVEKGHTRGKVAITIAA